MNSYHFTPLKHLILLLSYQPGLTDDDDRVRISKRSVLEWLVVGGGWWMVDGGWWVVGGGCGGG